jgi:hypothetical protein
MAQAKIAFSTNPLAHYYYDYLSKEEMRNKA